MYLSPYFDVKIIKLIKIVIKKSKLWNFDADRLKIAEVTAKWNFCRNYIIRYEVILQVKLNYFRRRKLSQLEVADINFRPISEDNRYSIWVSISYKISLVIQKLTLILFPKLAELKPNKIIVLFNWRKTEIGIHSRGQPTIPCLLVIF